MAGAPAEEAREAVARVVPVVVAGHAHDHAGRVVVRIVDLGEHLVPREDEPLENLVDRRDRVRRVAAEEEDLAARQLAPVERVRAEEHARHGGAHVAVVAGVGDEIDPDRTFQRLDERRRARRVRSERARHVVQRLARGARPHPVARVDLLARHRRRDEAARMAEERRDAEPPHRERRSSSAVEDERRRRVAAGQERQGLAHGSSISRCAKKMSRAKAFTRPFAVSYRLVLVLNPRHAKLGLFAPLSLAAAALVSTSADAGAPGAIHGTAKGFEKLLPEVYVEAADAKNHRFNWRDLSPTVPAAYRALGASPSRDVCIAAFSGNNGSPFEPILVKISGGRTTPSTLVIPPGTRLSFKNYDPFPHKLFQVNDPKWAASAQSPQSQREWTPPGTGRYEIRDALFPSIRTFIVVEPTVARSVYPTRSGEFTIDQLQPGDYTLRAYFGGKQVGKEVSGIHVGDKGDRVDLKDVWNIGGESK